MYSNSPLFVLRNGSNFVPDVLSSSKPQCGDLTHGKNFTAYIRQDNITAHTANVSTTELSPAFAEANSSNSLSVLALVDRLTIRQRSLRLPVKIVTSSEAMGATGVAQSVKTLACRSEVTFGRGFDPRLG
ncbi:hypothetical protein ANN_10638 [Periplaneta americana]|uniref:Uncharacterized protein n=1 Tax=Periplaneta americana TaxID=6978 RepID=A0ABQ8T4G9_PERAM|nr:hypothetical protein ANN_10638 [Periplaneta americana]